MDSLPETEQQRLVLAHEYFRCDQAFLDFAELSVANIGGKSDKRVRLGMFDAYSRFLHHLYEFYFGISKLANNRERAANGIDTLIQCEVQRIMRLRAERIRRGSAASHENEPSYYEQPIPEDFAAHLRQARNRVAHADAKRAGGNGSMTLPDFYRAYHRYALLLYEEAEWLWKVDPEHYDWGEIEAFETAVHTSKNEHSLVKKCISRLRNWLLQRQILSAIRSRR